MIEVFLRSFIPFARRPGSLAVSRGGLGLLMVYAKLFNVPDDLIALARRARLIEAIHDDAKDLRTHLGAVDRQRVDEHLDHLREIQRRLELTSGTCEMEPEIPGESGDLLQKTAIVAELIAVALHCDLTRVFSCMLTSAGDDPLICQSGCARRHAQNLS